MQTVAVVGQGIVFQVLAGQVWQYLLNGGMVLGVRAERLIFKLRPMHRQSRQEQPGNPQPDIQAALKHLARSLSENRSRSEGKSF